MRQYLVIFSLIINICISCRQVYKPDINADMNTLVVEGLITDEISCYSVRLTKALASDNPYDKEDKYIRNATVTIYDEKGNQYGLTESSNGTYWTDSAILIGTPGKSYTLHIETPDGNIYESTPQLMLPNDFQDSIFVEPFTKEILIQNSNGQSTIQLTTGVNLMKNINNYTDSLPRFRFTSSITTEYRYFIFETPFYCWLISNPDKVVNLIDEKYRTASSSIMNHVICFIPTAYTYFIVFSSPDTTIIINAPIVNRIIRVTQYRLNQETYQYYKKINALLMAEGKIFDPVAVQLRGNITCLTDSKKVVLGFFEVSSVKTITYSNVPGSKIINKERNVTPLLSDCFNEVPDFWIE